jgi:uncharacterized repeat protein (TIGR01451 family)
VIDGTQAGALSGPDLAVTIQAVPDTVSVGATSTLTSVVTNLGSLPALAATLEMIPPAGLDAISVTPNSGSCDDLTLVCTIGRIDPGMQKSVTMVVIPTAEGNLPVSSSASLAGVDLDPDNDSAIAWILAMPADDGGLGAADMSLAGSDAPDPVPVGSDVNYQLDVANGGPDTAQMATFTATLPAGVTWISTTPSAGVTCSGTTVVTCDLGDLLNGDSASIAILVSTDEVGIEVFSASLTATTLDPDVADNVIVLSATVHGAGRCTIRGTSAEDVLTATAGRQVICGLGGNDVIRGLGGNDRLVGGPGDDRLLGGSGKDRLVGGKGRDRLLGGSGDDRLHGGSGRDRFNGGPGRDRCFVGRHERARNCA